MEAVNIRNPNFEQTGLECVIVESCMYFTLIALITNHVRYLVVNTNFMSLLDDGKYQISGFV
jgi:hypothetical protein